MAEGVISIDVGQLAKYIALIVAGCSLFFEVSKIKINPITALLVWIGRRMNGPINDKLEQYGAAIKKLDQKIDENEIDRIRWEILDFANSCRNGRLHTKDEFDHIIAQNQKYHKILDENGMKNGQIDLEYEYIEGLYKRCQKQNDFL